MSVILELSATDAAGKLKKPIDEAVFTVAVLRRLECANISTLDHRIVCQKEIYLANRFGVSPAYNFNLYIRGPYSPDLANDLFTLSQYFDKIPKVAYASEAKERDFNTLSQLVEKTCKNARKLEVITTLDYFKMLCNDATEAKKRTFALKKASETELIDAENILKQFTLW